MLLKNIGGSTRIIKMLIVPMHVYFTHTLDLKKKGSIE